MEETLKRVIYTLKTLDVRGFDSMNSLVGCVMALESVINTIEQDKEKEGGLDNG